MSTEGEPEPSECALLLEVGLQDTKMSTDGEPPQPSECAPLTPPPGSPGTSTDASDDPGVNDDPDSSDHEGPEVSVSFWANSCEFYF